MTYDNSFLDGRLVYEQYRYVVAHGIDPLALAALETLTSFFLNQRLLADRAHENFEKILGNHACILRSKPGADDQERAHILPEAS